MDLTETEHEELMFRRQALVHTMHELSEECWDTGWTAGLERDLYRIVFEGAHPEYGMGWITAPCRKQMLEWATLTDSWFVWSNEKGLAIPVSLKEARARFRRITSKQVPEGLTVREASALYELSGPDDWELEPIVAMPVETTGFRQWLNRARERYLFKTDPALYLRRRRDFQFVLGYGTCQVDLVQPRWLPAEAFVRAEGCSEDKPCKRIQLCVACAETGDPRW